MVLRALCEVRVEALHHCGSLLGIESHLSPQLLRPYIHVAACGFMFRLDPRFY